MQVTFKDSINFILTEDEIKQQIQKTIDNPSVIGIDNLRDRNPNVKFDCLLRGYIGEYAILRWFTKHEINIDATNYTMDGDNIDVDFYYHEKNIELKTSLVPDRDRTVARAIEIEDIKLIKRTEERIEDFRGDIHLQIYFDKMRKVKDGWLKSQIIDLKSRNLDYLYNSFNASYYLNDTFFVAWIDKPTLVQQINKLHDNITERTWTFPKSRRLFWNCKIQESKKPIDLINYLRAL